MEKKSLSQDIYRMNETLYEIEEILIENGGEITEEVEEKLALVEKSQADFADGLNTLISKAKVEDAFLDTEIKRLQGLKKSRKSAIESLKWRLKEFMLQNDINKIVGNYCKVTLCEGRESVQAEEEALIKPFSEALENMAKPSYIKVTASIDKTALMDYLKSDGCVIPTAQVAGEDIPLAQIVRNPYILIK